MFCSHCGAKLPDDSKFCSNCGEPTDEPENDGFTTIDGVDEAAGADAADDAVTAQLPLSGASSPRPAAAPVPSPAPYSEQELDAAPKGGLPAWALIAIAALAAALLVGGGVLIFNKMSEDSAAQQQAQADAAAQQQAAADAEAAKRLTVTVSGSDTTAFPTVSASIKVVDANGNGATGLVSTDIKLTEKRPDGSTADATVSGLVSNGGGAYQLSFTAQDSGDDAEGRSVSIACASADYSWDEVGFSYTAPAKKKPESSQSSDSPQPTTTQVLVVTTDSSADYMMPSSDSAYYSADDIKDLSDWELYLARNEIYARHGRGFDNADLQRYFYSKSWYRRTCDPDKFDESVLNKYEKANAATILAREKAIGSQYI